MRNPRKWKFQGCDREVKLVAIRELRDAREHEALDVAGSLHVAGGPERRDERVHLGPRDASAAVEEAIVAKEVVGFFDVVRLEPGCSYHRPDRLAPIRVVIEPR